MKIGKGKKERRSKKRKKKLVDYWIRGVTATERLGKQKRRYRTDVYRVRGKKVPGQPFNGKQGESSPPSCVHPKGGGSQETGSGVRKFQDTDR